MLNIIAQSPSELTGWASFLRTNGPYLALAVLFGYILFKLVRRSLDRSEKAMMEKENEAKELRLQREIEIKTMYDKREADLRAMAAAEAKHAEEIRRLASRSTQGLEQLAKSFETLGSEIIREIKVGRR